MSYLVFARKYRPQTFDQVVQQTHVTKTLANAIATGRVAHAILFFGPRGTGKTTVARILAKAMNCDRGPTAEPCNQCQSCLEITAGNAADVFEIDGASNNSVDQVRELRENLKYMPVHSRYKIYIIDEVHMLSLAAFNALLKTLEEPPGHILFMFATTEAHKIPVTILSRCQRHDLRRIDSQAIADHLRKICEAEKVQFDELSLSLIARESGGSMRDSLSLLDHILACTEGSVTVDLISELLGIVDHKHVFDLAEAVLQNDIHSVLEAIDKVWRHGYELKRFYADLVAHFHHLTLVKLGSRADQLIDLPAQEIQLMRTQTERIPESRLLQIFDLLFQAEPAIKLSSQPRLGLEMVFLKLFQTAPALPIQTLIDRLDQLQASMGDPSGSTDAAPGTYGQNPALENKNVRQAAESDQNFRQREVEQSEEAADAKEQAPEGQPVDMENLWQNVLGQVSKIKPALAGFLTKCTLRPVSEGRMEIEVNGNDFIYKNIARHCEALAAVCSEQMGRKVRLTVVANYEEVEAKLEQKEKTSRLKQMAVSHPLVMEALELFDGRIIDIKTP